VIWDNAAYHRCAAVKKWLSRPKCRIHLIQLPVNPGGKMATESFG
jgi:hypothetical protein